MTRLLVILLLSLMMPVAAGDVPYASADSSSSQEYALKAAFLFNFAKFTVWPANAFSDAQAPFGLCVLGTDPFGDAIKSIEGKTVKKRKLVVKYLEKAKQLDSCHVLFISRSEQNRLPRIFATLEALPILTVGDTDRFAQSGGVIRLFLKNKKIRFGINTDVAKRAGLTMSSRLLHVAEYIVENRH